jgi:hypothetical protein
MKRHDRPTSANDSKPTQVAAAPLTRDADSGLLARTRAVISVLLDISKLLDRGGKLLNRSLDFMSRLSDLGDQGEAGRVLLA